MTDRELVKEALEDLLRETHSDHREWDYQEQQEERNLEKRKRIAALLDRIDRKEPLYL